MGKIPFLVNNLQIKVGILFLLVALIPLGIVGAFSIKTAEDIITNMVSNELENVATDKAALLERWLSERRVDLQVVAGSSILKQMDAEQITPYLKLVQEKYGVYEGFVVISSEGAVVVDSWGGHVHNTEEPWYEETMAGKPYLSPIFFNPDSKQSVFRVSAPVVGDAGTVKGVVCAAVGTRTILSIILRVQLGQTGECYLVNGSGTFLAHKEPRRILTENIAQSGSFKKIFGSPDHGKIYDDYRGIEVLGASRRVADTDWYLVVEQDRDEAFRSADGLKRYVYLVLAFSACGAMVVALLLSFYIAQPIRTLSEAANALAGGEFQAAAVKTDRTDEIGSLYHAFQHMANRLQERQIGLKEKADLTQEELRQTDVKLKKTELAAARSEQLAALGRLAAGVTHEIRTPLTSLKLFLESVRGEIEISPEYQEDFHIAMHQVKRIETTINRFLDYARPQEPIFSTIDTAQLIEDALLLVKPKANHQQVALQVMVDDNLPKIRGDKKQLGDVLLNLMVNALEAMTSHGRLIVSAMPDRCERDGKLRACVRIDVCDTGPGIKTENISKLFDPFFTTKASGSGLGLSIVQSTVGRHGGAVKVQSAEGEGTTFSVFLPSIAAQGI
jgi:two-component system, NtrC family, sensor kinase